MQQFAHPQSSHPYATIGSPASHFYATVFSPASHPYAIIGSPAINPPLCNNLLTCRVGQNRIYTPYMTVYLVISLPMIPYIHRIYIWFWPTLLTCNQATPMQQFAHPHFHGSTHDRIVVKFWGGYDKDFGMQGFQHTVSKATACVMIACMGGRHEYLMQAILSIGIFNPQCPSKCECHVKHKAAMRAVPLKTIPTQEGEVVVTCSVTV